MAQIKRVSVNQLEKLIKPLEDTIVIPTENGEEISVIVYKNLSFDNALEFIATIVDVVCNLNDSDQNPTEYNPEYIDFMIRYATIQYYTNCNLPKKVAKQYALLYHTNIYQSVINSIDQSQWNELINAAKAKIEFYQSKINSVGSSLLGFAKQLMDMSGVDMSDMSKFDATDLKKIISGIGSLKDLGAKDLISAIAVAEQTNITE